MVERDSDAADGSVSAEASPLDAGEGDSPLPLEQQLAAANDRVEEYLDLARRARADYANLKRRVDEERATLGRDATTGLVLKLLSVVDDLERARTSATPELLETPWGRGVQLIERNLRSVLTGENVEPIEALGVEFSPWEHEAVAHLPSADAAEGTVLQVVRTGYRRGDRVLRPAQVVVARRPD